MEIICFARLRRGFMWHESERNKMWLIKNGNACMVLNSAMSLIQGLKWLYHFLTTNTWLRRWLDKTTRLELFNCGVKPVDNQALGKATVFRARSHVPGKHTQIRNTLWP